MPPRKRSIRPTPSGRARFTGPRTVLVAIVGLSPAVLTETIWALARQPKPVVPDRIVVLTTEAGRVAITNQLFGRDELWLSLRARILGRRHAADPRLDFDCTPDRIHVFHRRVGSRRVPIFEIADGADHAAIADAMVDVLWSYTSQPDTRVIASLAGGYKTMSALMLSVMQLLANPGDRVTHVLISGGFEAAKPGFYFPEQPSQDLIGPAGRLRAMDAGNSIKLIDVPVIPLRRWFEDVLNTRPPAYDVLVNQGAAALQAARTADLQLELGPVAPAGRTRHHARINGIRLELSPHQFAYLRFFAGHRHAGESPFDCGLDAAESLAEWVNAAYEREPRFYTMKEAVNEAAFTGEKLGKRLYDLGAFLTRACEPGRRLAPLLPGKGCWSLQLPPEAITLHD